MFHVEHWPRLSGPLFIHKFLTMARNIFNSIKVPRVGTNRFDLSHDVKMSFKMGYLIPTAVMEVLPGDRFNISVENMLRFAPLISPVMHRVNVTTHAYFIPYRVLWPEWEDWITRTNTEVEAPYINTNWNILPKSIGDYLGYAYNATEDVIRQSPFAIAAYYKVFDEYYRDQNLQTELFQPLIPGFNDYYDAAVGEFPLSRAWMHDYFTGCLPFPQKGPTVTIPLVVEENIPVQLTDGDQPMLVRDADTRDLSAAGDGGLRQSTGPVPYAGSLHISDSSSAVSPKTPAVIDPNGQLVVDVNAGAASVNDLRRAYALQRWFELLARAGSRYIEQIGAFFGVRSSDARLQRPEYIGGSYQTMTISEVLSTAQTDTGSGPTVTTPIGQMGGHGISVGGGRNFSYRAEEHGLIMMIINVQPVTAYQQGLHKMFTRFDPLDFYWPQFANIGEQEVRVKELYSEVATAADAEETFGYVPRYAEYKFLNSRVHGEMKDNLSYWHLGRIFSDKPVLDEDFIKVTSDPLGLSRIFAVQDDGVDHIYAHIFNRVSALRKMPRYGTPI